MAYLERRIRPYSTDWTDSMMADYYGRIVPYFLDWTHFTMADFEGKIVSYLSDCVQV